MDIGYSINTHGFISPTVSIPGKDPVPIVIFLEDIRLCLDTILAEIDEILTGNVNRYDWSGDQAFATITRNTAILEAQWIRDESGAERSETLPTEVLRELVSKWGKILLRVRSHDTDRRLDRA
ncbi:hypothetical protein [Fimbriiglobus ruber]|uniref:Uncharacterized protein n=1 Tax=Fimbriiglobus ruber TaxID=1908690 RepID=A0A225DR14_9BACT|nr:hypothetical protein [Fimbriiglobus ruber]OWK41058.1 hypothetical protein FRUB_04950 [Fimbriiglobus ruber]